MKRILCRLMSVCLLALAATSARGEMTILEKEDFEKEGVEARMALGKDCTPTVMVRVPTSTLGGYAGITSPGWAWDGVGEHCLMLRPVEGNKNPSITFKTVYTRERIRELGGVVVQGDVYVPPDGKPLLSSALIAAPQGKADLLAFYRFGFRTSAKNVFFSHMDGVNQVPKIFFNQATKGLPVNRPGWNRLQMLITPEGKMYFALNGEEPNYSPITDISMDNLTMGFFVAMAEISEGVLLDNLVVYRADGATSFPPIPAAGAVARATPQPEMAMKTSMTSGGLLPAPKWQEDTAAAWRECRGSLRPILVVFTNPEFGTHSHLMKLINNNQEWNELSQEYILLMIDLNTEAGKRNAQKFGIYVAPTMLMIGPDAKEMKRLAVQTERTDWTTIRQFIQ